MPFNSLWPSYALGQHNWVSTGSGDGMLPDDTKPLPEPVLTSSVTSIAIHLRANFTRNTCHQSPKLASKLLIWNFTETSPGTNEFILASPCLQQQIYWVHKMESSMFSMEKYFSTHLQWTKWLPFLQMIFSNEFSWMKMEEFWYKFHWKLFPAVQLPTSQHWFR